MELVYSVAFFALVMVLITLWVRRKSAASWSGVVEKVREVTKTHHQDDQSTGTTEHYMRVHARSDAGKRIKVEMPLRTFEALYPEGLGPGVRIAKRPGEWYPSYEEAAAPARS
jgi:hypothetical protein